MKPRIKIIEVGPRDGFQSVDEFIPTALKLQIIERIVEAGVGHIQVTSFVNPKAVPQMKDAREVARHCIDKYPDISFSALVPNYRGAKDAVESGLSEINYVISVSETHNLKNVKRTHDESFDELGKIIEDYPGLQVNLDAATVFGCHYEGIIPPEQVISFLRRARAIGVKSFNLCDTVGLAHPKLIRTVLGLVLQEFPDCEFQVHIHDTRNMGMINSFAAIECGIDAIQTSLGGLGGCPFAPGASGNTATEDFVYMLDMMGYETGVDSGRLIEAAKYLRETVKGNYSGHHILIDMTRVCAQ